MCCFLYDFISWNSGHLEKQKQNTFTIYPPTYINIFWLNDYSFLPSSVWLPSSIKILTQFEILDLETFFIEQFSFLCVVTLIFGCIPFQSFVKCGHLNWLCLRGVQGEEGSGGEEGEMAQTMYAHMNKWIKKKINKLSLLFDMCKENGDKEFIMRL
jgi:hypothetical protein